MAVVPAALLHALKEVPYFDEEAFVQIHAASEKITSIRINPAKFSLEDIAAIGGGSANAPSPKPVPWSQTGFYLEQRPSFTFDPLFHAGAYYVQEASSMFLEQALLQNVDLAQPLKVLDLCAAPGGKSTHLQSLISPQSLLVSNEVIKPRAGILKQNLTKWGGANVVVTANDPQHFARLEGFFDVLVVDAPCSGSGLFRRDPEAIKEWSEDAVALCSGRQKRILADALLCLKEGGLLIYATCSYSPEEDEEIAAWLLTEKGLEPRPLRVADEWQIVATSAAGAAGYRFFPDKLKGEGFYMAAFLKKTGAHQRYKTAKPEKATAKERLATGPWLQDAGMEILKEGFLYAFPETLMEAYSTVKANLYVQHAGIRLGEVMKSGLVPDHALALSSLLTDGVPATELSREEAIRYLQRQELSITPQVRGWQTVAYHSHNLGWINALPNRVNNYYPKEARILKLWDGS